MKAAFQSRVESPGASWVHVACCKGAVFSQFPGRDAALRRPVGAAARKAGISYEVLTRRPYQEPRFAGAFTLIELMLAISIMCIILVAINGVFFTALRMRNTAVNSLEANLPVEQALNVLRHDLANVIGSTNTNGVFIGPLQTINQTNILPNQVGPDFYSSGGELDGVTPWGNMEKIDYLLTAPTNGSRGPGMDLIRAVTRNLLPLSQPTQPDEKHTILSGVQSMMFFYYDGTQWDQTWDTTQQTNLPLAIKVQIHMTPERGASTQPAPLELVVPIDVLLNTNTITALQ